MWAAWKVVGLRFSLKKKNGKKKKVHDKFMSNQHEKYLNNSCITLYPSLHTALISILYMIHEARHDAYIVHEIKQTNKKNAF